MSKNTKNSTTTMWIIILIILVALFLRIWTINEPFYADENVWPYAAADHSRNGWNFVVDLQGEKFVWSSPPLAPLMYRFFTWFIGVNNTTIRMLPLVLGLINILLTYSLAKKLFNKKIALIAALIMAISFWHIIESFLVEHDGSILMFFWLCFLNLYTEYERTNKKVYLAFAGVVLGLALMTKLTGGLIVIVLLAYILWTKKSLIKAYLISWRIVLIGAGIFLIFPLYSLISSPGFVERTISHSEVLTLVPSAFTILRIIIYMLLWATPLLSCTLLLNFLNKKYKWFSDSNKLLFSWIGVVLVFYIFTKYSAAIDRYTSIIIPALAILSAKTFCDLHDLLGNNKNNIKKLLLYSAIFLLFFVALNFINSEWIAHNIREYIFNAISFKWDFIFQFHGSSGPGFMTSFIPIGAAILLMILIAIVMIALAYFNRYKPSSFAMKDSMTKKNLLPKKDLWIKRDLLIKKELLIMLVAVFIAFNLFLVQAFIIKYPYPHVGKVQTEMSNYLISEYNSESPDTNFYLTDMNMAWYINPPSNPDYDTAKKRFIPIGDIFSDEIGEYESIKESISQDSSSVIAVLDYPKKSNEDNTWKLTENCILEKRFVNNGLTLGYVYKC